jgi:hypothetical protein
MKKLTQFLVKLWEKIKNLFSKIPDEFKNAVHLGVEITENLKGFIDSPVADVLTAIIPGNADDIIKAKLRQALPVFLQSLKLADSTLNLQDPNLIIQTALQSLRELDPVLRPGVYHNLSVLLTQRAADGKLSWSDGVYLSQWYYDNKFKPAQ